MSDPGKRQKERAEKAEFRLAVDGVLLPQRLAAFLVEMVDDVPDEAILELVKHHPGLAKAYSVRTQNVPTFRDRIRRDLSNAETVAPPLRPFLLEAALGGSLRGFSTDFLRDWFHELMAAAGEDRLLVGILLDSREEVRAIGLERVRHGSRRKRSSSEQDPVRAAQTVMSTLAPLLAPLLQAAEAAEVSEDPGKDLAIWEAGEPFEPEALRENEALGKQLGKAERELQRLRDRLQREKEASGQAEKKAREEKALRKEADAARRRAEAGNETLQERLRRLVDDGVEQGLKQETLRWLRAPREIETAAGPAPTLDDVATEAGAALERQAERDRHFGNRRTLHVRLEELDRLAREVEDARHNAVQPLSELGSLADRIAKDSRRLRTLLGEGEPVPPVVAALQAELNACGSIPELQDLRRVVDALEEHRLVPGADLRRLRVAHRTVMSRLLNPYAPTIRTHEAPPDDPAWSLVRALAGKDPLGIVIDGHNLLYAMEQLHPEQRDPVEHTRVRTGLIGRIVRMTGNLPHCRVTLFFDSSVHSREAAAPNVEVIYSGGTGDHRADQGIVAWLSRDETADGERHLVVTGDRDLRIAARNLGALVMGSAEFSTFLGEEER